jgi:outer membrane protein assembly factor BamD
VRKNLRFLIIPAVASLLLAGCHSNTKKKPEVGTSAEPDKVLYERALEDIRKNHHTVGRLTLQTLINTYPDSEYLAKAKLAIADSYYKEGGTANMAQAITEFKDFGTFFPFLHEAAYAQMQVGMAHYRQMEKPDRDRTHARAAEDEFQVFLQKYPDSELAPKVEQKLRDVQEMLAEGDYRIARFYYVKGSLKASAVRLSDLTSRYPLYSQSDKALWMLARIWEKAEKSDVAAQYYAKIVREYPLSDLVPDAKAQLTHLGVPVPQPNPEALARMQKEREAERDRPSFMRRSLGFFKGGPDVSMSARGGKPTLTPEGETNTETLTPGGTSSVGGTGGATGSGSTAVVETVTPGSPGSSTDPNAASPSPTAPGTNANTDPSAKPDPNAASAKPSGDSSKSSDKDKKDDDKKKKEKESSSKKKKGLRKIFPPW